jgi:hypothetical protein
MAMFKGLVTVDNTGAVVGGSNGLAREIYDLAFAKIQATPGSGFATGPSSTDPTRAPAPHVGNRQTLACICTAVAEAVVDHLIAHAVVTGTDIA